MQKSEKESAGNDPVKIISLRDNFHFVKEWYDLANEDHFWIKWRFKILEKMLAKASISTCLIKKGVDVGCGNSVLRKQIETATAWNMDGYDLDRYALSMNPDTRGALYLYDIRDRNEEFSARYDLLTMFDILEHYHDPVAFLQAAAFHLKNEGICIINVPAIELLRSRYDEVAGHELRYSKKILRKQLEAAGFEVIDIRYWGFSLILPLWIRRFVVSFCEDEGDVIKKGFKPPSDLTHSALKVLSWIESTLLTRPPLGTSIMAIAIKKCSSNDQV